MELSTPYLGCPMPLVRRLMQMSTQLSQSTGCQPKMCLVDHAPKLVAMAPQATGVCSVAVAICVWMGESDQRLQHVEAVLKEVQTSRLKSPPILNFALLSRRTLYEGILRLLHALNSSPNSRCRPVRWWHAQSINGPLMSLLTFESHRLRRR